MGAGKTKIGRRLAARLSCRSSISDGEIEAAAGETIEDIFRNRGEAVFRDGERRVIARLLDQPPHVLATGGGAFMDPQTRAVIARRGVSVWLRADLDVLFARVSRRNNRPLLTGTRPARGACGADRAALPDLCRGRHHRRQRRRAAGADRRRTIMRAGAPERALCRAESERELMTAPAIRAPARRTRRARL